MRILLGRLKSKVGHSVIYTDSTVSFVPFTSFLSLSNSYVFRHRSVRLSPCLSNSYRKRMAMAEILLYIALFRACEFYDHFGVLYDD
jgi:hypothetical protein